MLQFSANLGLLWPELPLTERVHAAAQAGFAAVECHWPYDTNPTELLHALEQTNLSMLCLNTSPGNIKAGEFGLCALPGREPDARASIDQAIEYAHAIHCQNIHVMAGVPDNTQYSAQEITHTFQQNLNYAIRQDSAINVLIEPINHLDRPGYALYKTNQALALIAQNPQLKLMFDCYHIQKSGDDLLKKLDKAWQHIGHIQIAASPDRHEPDHGDIDFNALFSHLSTKSYQGYIGAEYIPRATTNEGLDWLTAYNR